jgi:predicted amidohydrolase YtcJ
MKNKYSFNQFTKLGNSGKTALGVILSSGIMMVGFTTSAAPAPDAIYFNGKILTVDANFSIVSALAVRDGRIVATGDSEQTRKLAGNSTKLVDLHGRTVIPGLIDNHLHFMRDALRWGNEARLDGVTSRKEALGIIAAKAGSLKPGEPVLVMGGWSEKQFADKPGAFTREELDEAAPMNPVVIQKSYMNVYLNTLAEKSGGKAGSGKEAINRTVLQFVPPLTETQSLESIKSICASLNAMGLTTVYDVGQESDGPMERIATLEKCGELSLRVFNTLRNRANSPEEADEAVRFIKSSKPFQNNDWCGVIGIGEHTYSPIHDSTKQPTEYPDEDYQQFEKLATAAAAGGWHIQEHAMQDLTIHHFLDIFERIYGRFPLPRWTLAHCDKMTIESLERAKKLGLTIALHNHTVKPAGRGGDSPLVKAIQESGIVWGLGSDGGTVAPINPFSTLWWVVTGKIYPDRKVLQGVITREAALIAHTRSNAYLLFKEKDLGSLEPEKLADFLVLDRDYLTVPEDEIRNLHPVLTVVGGKVVFEQNDVISPN